MDLRTAELREAANRLLDHLEENGRREIDLDSDFYWSIPDDALYDVYRHPRGITIGQLSSDAEEIRRIASAEAPPIAFALVWLAALLRLVGTKVVE